MAQNLKFKIREFEWFQMQTKVRQIIQEILTPIQKRILQSSSILNKVKNNQAQDELRIQQISLMIANDPKVFQTGVFATVDRKFIQNSKLLEQLSRQIEQENKYVQDKFKILDLRMEENIQVLKNVASFKQRVSREMEIQNDNVNHLRRNIQKMIQDLNLDIRTTRKQIVDSAEMSEKRDVTIDEEIRRIRQNILTIQDNICIHKEMHHQKTLQLQQHQRLLQKHNQDIKELLQSKHLTKKLNDCVQDMENELKKVIFKVQSINPLITQAQISQCLVAILPPKIKNKITIYEHKKYFQLNKQVLQKDFRRVQNKFNGIGLIEQMQKKCTKQIVQLKRRKLLQMGIDIDHLSYQQRQRYYNEISLDDQLNIDYEQTKVTQTIDQGQIRKIMQKFIFQYMSQFKDQVKIQIQDSKKYLYCVQDQIKYQVQKFNQTILSVKNQCTAFYTQHVLQLKLANNLHKQSQGNIKCIQQKLRQQQQLQRLFYNFCSLLNHLSIQDEIDKQNISLFGSKQSTSEDLSFLRQKQSPIALDGKCLSCIGYPTATLTAFKMACLSYYPSSIRIDSKEYKREQLLEFTTSMLQNIKHSIQDNNTQRNKFDFKEGTYNQINENLPRQSIGLRAKSKTMNAYEDISPFKSSLISKHIQTQGCPNNQQKVGTGLKYRKKTLNTTYSSSLTKKKNSIKKTVMNQEMLKTSIIFNSLKKKNHSFLN